jgi:hypothetical protein
LIAMEEEELVQLGNTFTELNAGEKWNQREK